MLVSIPANPVPAELYQFYSGSTSSKWLPWYIWGGGVYATKYGYNPASYIGYLGTISVPFEDTVNVKSLRVVGSVEGKTSTTQGAMLLVRLFQRTGNLSSPIATIFVDRRNVAVTNPYIDITQLVAGGGFLASASNNSLAIEVIGEGQGLATVTALVADLS
jgi:hypothetical protein